MAETLTNLQRALLRSIPGYDEFDAWAEDPFESKHESIKVDGKGIVVTMPNGETLTFAKDKDGDWFWCGDYCGDYHFDYWEPDAFESFLPADMLAEIRRLENILRDREERRIEIERPKKEVRLRRQAKRNGLVATKSRRNGMWYFADYNNNLQSPEDGLTLGEAERYLGLQEYETEQAIENQQQYKE